MRHVHTVVEMCTDFFQGEYANADTYPLQVFKIMFRLKYYAARLFY